jgi:hypothetical protein
MPLHEYIQKIYCEVKDPSYIIRFMTFIIKKRCHTIKFTINNTTVIPLINGLLEDINSKEQYYSFAQFYNKVKKESVDETDMKVFKYISLGPKISIWRIICHIKEEEILEFFDQTYRSYILYKDFKRRNYRNLEDDSEVIDLLWDGDKFELRYDSIICENNKEKVWKLLEQYENSIIKNLYYK